MPNVANVISSNLPFPLVKHVRKEKKKKKKKKTHFDVLQFHFVKMERQDEVATMISTSTKMESEYKIRTLKSDMHKSSMHTILTE
jgi:hypothetical protein